MTFFVDIESKLRQEDQEPVNTKRGQFLLIQRFEHFGLLGGNAALGNNLIRILQVTLPQFLVSFEVIEKFVQVVSSRRGIRIVCQMDDPLS